MGLIARYRRLRYVWGWRLRYWWLDTQQGRHAQRTLAVLVLIGFVVQSVRAGLAVARPASITHPQQAILWWVVYLIVAAVVAVAAYLMMPGTKAPDPDQQAKAPTTQDGRSAVRHYGTVWIDDPAMLAWKVVGRDPIKAKGGK